MQQSKTALRVAALSQRNSLPADKVDFWSLSIQARVLDALFYRIATAIALYSSVQNEVATDRLREQSFHLGKRVFYPRLVPLGGLEFVEIESAADLKTGKFGIPEPSGEKRLSDSQETDLLLIVPGVAFDQSGNRLGRGEGWYDSVLRTLGGRATVVGLGYEFQMVETVPVDRWDQKVEFVVTQDRLIDCRKGAQAQRTGLLE